MVLVLSRTYFPEGTNGKLECEGKLICNTIELPWKMNETKVSCIPEGKYFIRKRYSAKYKWHLEVLDVPKRKFILFHPANNAQKELQGCIAPVTKLSGPGLGLMSRIAFTKLKDIVYKALDNKESVELIVQQVSAFAEMTKKQIMNKIVERASAPTPKFFKVLRTIGLVLATVGTAVLTAPVSLPVIVTTVGGYVAVAGGVISAVSQLTVEKNEQPQ